MAFTDEADHPSPFRDVVTRIEAQEQQRPVGERTVIASMAQDGLLPQEGSVLVLGSPESRSGIQSILANHCGERATLNDRGVTVMGTAHERAWAGPAGQLPPGRSSRQRRDGAVCGHAAGRGEGGAAALFTGGIVSCYSRMERWSPAESGHSRAIVRRCVLMQAIPFGKWCMIGLVCLLLGEQTGTGERALRRRLGWFPLTRLSGI